MLQLSSGLDERFVGRGIADQRCLRIVETIAVEIAHELADFEFLDFDGHDAQFVKRLQFVRRTDRIAVGINPDAQGGKLGVVRVDDAFGVGVQFAERCKAARLIRAEQLRDIVDRTVAIDIAHQQPIAARHPRDLLSPIIAIDVEIRRRPPKLANLNPIAVKVENERVGAFAD